MQLSTTSFERTHGACHRQRSSARARVQPDREIPGDSDTQAHVYIRSKGAKWHSTPQCVGLSKRRYPLQHVPLEQAEANGYMRCKFCSK